MIDSRMRLELMAIAPGRVFRSRRNLRRGVVVFALRDPGR